MAGANQGNCVSPAIISDALNPAVPPTGSEPQAPNISSDTGADDDLASIWAAIPIVAIVFATATLYRGRDVLMPVAMALILAVIFTPMSNLLDCNKPPDEVRAFVKSFAPHLLCFSCTVVESLPAALELIIALKQDSPNLTIIGGGKAALWEAPKLLAAGCAEVFGSREEARRAMRRFALKRARSRMHL